MKNNRDIDTSKMVRSNMTKSDKNKVKKPSVNQKNAAYKRQQLLEQSSKKNSNQKNGQNNRGMSQKAFEKQKADNMRANILAGVTVVLIVIFVWFLSKFIINLSSTTPLKFKSHGITSVVEVSNNNEPTKNDESAVKENNKNSEKVTDDSTSDKKEKSNEKASLEKPKTLIGKSFTSTTNVNVRDKAGKNSKVISQLKKGSSIKNISKTEVVDNEVWVFGEIEGSEGHTIKGWVYGPILDIK